jgi:hypothetical protein
MVSKSPVKLLPDRVHLFEVERARLRAVEWNVPLLPGDGPPRDDAPSA